MKKIGAVLLLASLAAACGQGERPRAARTGVPALAATELQGYEALPAVIESSRNPVTAEKVALGRMLYFDTRLSAHGDVSCYVCHPLHDYGTSHRARGVGDEHQQGGRNEPTVYNAAGHVAQFWDGRAPDVEAQALGPVLNPVEMGMSSGALVVSRLKAIPGYEAAFRAAFPGEADPMTFENFGRAVGAFERGLVTPSRWDDYVAGDHTALTAREVAGFREFASTGCGSCHGGRYVGGGAYQKLGLVRAWPGLTDPGRFQVTGQAADRGVFKVASLRNVEETWPYFHDGSVQRLEDAVRLMARHQLGRDLTDAQVTSIVAWLKTLTGRIPESYIQEPVLPASVPQSPLPFAGG